MAKSEALLKVLQEVVALQGMLEPSKPLKKEDEDRLWKKFRLEWNYNSNHIEGNTLTYQQTELLLIFDKTTGDKDMREYEEMKAHDVAVNLVRDYAKDKSRDLTEADIREWNKIILVRPFWGNAQTPDGQSTRKLIEPGVYKKEPNSVRLQNGEIFHYASPEETPAKMADLIAWYKHVTKENKMHPVEIAAQLHYDFVRIHPFDDSNGRTSRLLMNYVLLKCGYPPVIIKSADKKEYLNALNKADVGDLEAFIEYIAKQLVWSLQLNIKAAKSEGVEEIGDVGKKISLWKREIESKEGIANQFKSLLSGFYSSSMINLMLTFIFEHYEAFNDLFGTKSINIQFNEGKSKYLELLNLKVKTNPREFDMLLNLINGGSNKISFEVTAITISFSFLHFNKKILKPKRDQFISQLIVILGKTEYKIFNKNLEILTRNYQDPLTDNDCKQITEKCMDSFLKEIQSTLQV